MHLCMGCMNELGEETLCPNCGYDEAVIGSESSAFLKPGTTLRNERFTVGVALGQGGFGITYIGYDNILNTKVAIKEYYPSDMVGRANNGGTVSPFTMNTDDYGKGKERFIEEARTLAKFAGHPCIVGVKDCFEENGTAYMVMEFLEGVSLKEYLSRKGGKVSVNEAISILTPVVDALRAVHKVGIIHRDISPDNIYVTTDARVRLIDFGAARQSVGGHKSLSVMLKPGYAPEEQYRTRGNQGPWTDVYALTATLYRMITGSVPPDALERVLEDNLEIPEGLSPNVQAAIRHGLAVRASERYSSVDRFYAELTGGEASCEAEEVTVANSVPETGKERVTVLDDKTEYKTAYAGDKNTTNKVMIAAIAAFAAVAVVSVVCILVLAMRNNQPAQTAAVQQVQQVQQEEPPATVSLPDLYRPGSSYNNRMHGIDGATLVTLEDEYQGACDAVKAFCDNYAAFVNSGSRSEEDYRMVLDGCVQVNSEIYKRQWNYFVKHHITYYNVNEVRFRSAKKNGNVFFVWNSETYEEMKDGSMNRKTDNWVYRIEYLDGEYLLTDYTSDPAY